MIICDVDQEIDVRKWTWHLLKTNRKKHGILKTVKVLSSATEVREANKEIQRKQQSGAIWKHTLEEFEQWFSKDYTILEKKSCFLNCSNLLVLEKKA